MSWRSKTFDVLPALSVRRAELRRSLRIATVSWLYGSAWAVLVSGVQLKNFARMLGFGDVQLNVLSAAPAVASIGMIFAAVVIEQSGLRKHQFLQCATIHRLLWLVIAGIPLVMMVPSTLAVGAMLLVYSLSWLAQSFANPAWTTWMGDLVPRRIRGRYFAARFGFGRVIQVVIVVAIGLLLDAVTVPNAPETAGGQPRLLYTICAIFAVAGVIGAAEILMYRRIREIMPVVKEGPPLKPMLFRDCFHDKTFNRYLLYGITISFATAVPGFFFWVYTTEVLGFSKLATNIVYMVVSPILGMIGLQVWGRLLDRWGRRPVLTVATFMTVFSVTPYFFTTPHTPWPQFITHWANGLAGAIGPHVGKIDWVWITPDMPVGAYLLVCLSCVIGGIGWTGVMMGQNNFMMAFSDTHGRSRYVAVAQVACSLGSVAGAFIGGLVVYILDSISFTALYVGPFVWNKYHATFALSGMGRFFAVLWMVGMVDPGAGKVRDMVRSMGLIAYTNVSNWFLYPFRAIGHSDKDDRPKGDRG